MTRFFSLLCRFHVPRVMLSLAAAMYAIVGPSHAAFESAGSRPSRSEHRLLADAMDGRLHEYSLMEAALVAGGTTTSAEIEPVLQRFESLVQELRRTLDTTAPVANQARAVHAFLHSQVLVAYRTEASDVAEALTTGTYNCVSGSVLYVALAQRCGLNAHAVQLPEHVRCEVLADGMAIPIETTSLNPAASLHSAKSRRTRILNDVTLMATLYYNRGVAAFDSGDLERAISLNTIAIDLDPTCKVARANLLAAINNRVVELMKSRNPAAARQLLEQGLRIEPDYRPFLANRAYLQQLP